MTTNVCESCLEAAIDDNGAPADIAADACMMFGGDLSDHYCDSADGTDCACTGHYWALTTRAPLA